MFPNFKFKAYWIILIIGLLGCQQTDSPSLPVPTTIYSSAIKPVDYHLQRFSIDSNKQAYGVKGNTLYRIDSHTDETSHLYQFSAAILGFHITINDRFIISTDNDHWSPNSPCEIYESVDRGESFTKIKSITGGCALWMSISSDKDENIYLGEYGPKKPNISKNVWKYDVNTGHWQIIFQAPLESNAHIHRVAIDPYLQNLWVSVGDTVNNRGIFLSKDQGKNWQHKLDSQATAVAFTQHKIYWGEDSIKIAGVSSTDKGGENQKVEFRAKDEGNYAGSIYQLLALPDNSILAPIMKYPDKNNISSLWRGVDGKWHLLMMFESKSGQGVDVSSIAGPDKNGYVLLSGFKIDYSKLE